MDNVINKLSTPKQSVVGKLPVPLIGQAMHGSVGALDGVKLGVFDGYGDFVGVDDKEGSDDGLTEREGKFDKEGLYVGSGSSVRSMGVLIMSTAHLI